ncbi:cell surface protein [Lactiplantibacillus pentosus]|uniref:cell surface protein n=1 Tax=Lactiplantibacillus pentosus TaxID=1589 RepID=UPI0021A94B32|nr:cell surface protein [Lactiplantibacillus pentosus]MCT3065673.1 cell surface protein [Lactiplantibacillus pentosus]
MRRYQKIISLSLLLVSGLCLLWGLRLTGHAATGLTSAMTTMPTSSTSYYSIYETGNVVGYNISGGIGSYPKLTKVTANYANEGRLSTKTTSMALTFSGTLTANSAEIKSLYYDVFYKSADADSGTSLVTTTPSNMAYGTSSVTMNSTKTLSVNMSKLKDDLPVYVGFRLTTTSGVTATYRLAVFNKVSLKTTLDTPTSTDSKLTGSGIAGNTVSTTINGTTYTATIGSDGKYEIKLNNTLNGVSSVTVTPLTIKSTTTSVNLSVTDLEGLTSDADVVSWLVKQAGVVATNPSNASDTMTYYASESDLLTTFKGLADNGSTTVHVYAKSASGLKSEELALQVTKLAGTLSFSELSSSLGFGNLTVPVNPTVYQPTSTMNVTVADTRSTGSKWYLYVSATPLTSTTVTGRTLKGDLIYRDGSTDTVLTNQSMLVQQGQKVAGTTDTKVTSDWSNTKGIGLSVQPGIYADTYQGTLKWTLTDTPDN